MKWFRRRREPGWTSHFAASKQRTPPREPAPTPRELIEVLGLAMTVTASGIPLTLLSLERYREGDVLNFRFTSRRGLHLDFASPDMFITVGPASATATPRFSLMGGSSGGNGQEIVHRFSFGVTPGMPDGATDWVVEVTKIVWNRHRSGGEYTVANVDEGPWRFVIRP